MPQEKTRRAAGFILSPLPCPNPRPAICVLSMEALPVDNDSHFFLLITCMLLRQALWTQQALYPIALTLQCIPAQESVPETESSRRTKGQSANTENQEARVAQVSVSHPPGKGS